MNLINLLWILFHRLINTNFFNILFIQVIFFWLILIFLSIWIDFFLRFWNRFIIITFLLFFGRRRLIFLYILKHLFLRFFLLIHHCLQFYIFNWSSLNRLNRWFNRIILFNLYDLLFFFNLGGLYRFNRLFCGLSFYDL